LREKIAELVMALNWKKSRYLAVSVFVLGLSSAAASDDITAESPPQSASDVRAIVHNYILAHPEVLIESLRLAKQKQEDEAAAATKTFIAAHKEELLADPKSPVLGNARGDVTVVEFFDYRCPYCRQAEPLLQKLINDDPNVRIVQKQLPILGPTSVIAARAALAADKQNKHLSIHNALMSQKASLDEADILHIAEGLGLDVLRLKTDMASPAVNAEITANIRVAKQLGLTGTPAFIVGSELIPGATDLATLKSLIIDTRLEAHRR
jgi:protein-disulfide isomerase